MGASLSSPRPYQECKPKRTYILFGTVRAVYHASDPHDGQDAGTTVVRDALERSVIAWAPCPPCYDTSCVSPKATPSLCRPPKFPPDETLRTAKKEVTIPNTRHHSCRSINDRREPTVSWAHWYTSERDGLGNSSTVGKSAG